MKKTIRNLMLAGCFFFTVSFDSCNLGISYDKKHKLYKEIDFSGCTMSEVYGKRWERISKSIVSVAVIVDIVVLMILYRQNQRKNESIFSLIENK